MHEQCMNMSGLRMDPGQKCYCAGIGRALGTDISTGATWRASSIHGTWR